MNSYVLLRNNKESGSLSLADLEQIGLKSSDLIWVECQSVGWRNPGEIAELKALLSEESRQGHDQDKHQSSAINREVPEITAQKAAEKKIVFAELPADLPTLSYGPAVKKQEDVLPFNEPDSSDIFKYGGLSSNSIKPTIEKTPADITTKYSRPLEEIKEMYVKNMEQEQMRSKSIIAIRLPKEFKRVAVYASFVLIGAVSMLLIKKNRGKQSTARQQNILQPALPNTKSDTASMEPAQMNAALQASEKQLDVPIEETSSSPADEKRSAIPEKRSMADDKTGDNSVNQNINKGAIEKNRQPINEVIAPKPIPAEVISSMVSIKANNYIIGSFGGIRNLEMTLQNDSKYLLDKVTVELTYLNPEGIVLKTENIHFQSVHPDRTETIAVKKSKRGVKIAYKITKIESKETAIGTSGL